MNHGAKRFLRETFARLRPDNSLTIKTVSTQLKGNREGNYRMSATEEKPSRNT